MIIPERAPSGNSPLFIAFAEQDEATAREIARGLEHRGLATWLFTGDQRAGSWRRQVEQAIADSRGLICLVSRHTERSDEVGREIQYALDRQLLILPLRLEDVRSSLSIIDLERKDYFADPDVALDWVATQFPAPVAAGSPADIRAYLDRMAREEDLEGLVYSPLEARQQGRQHLRGRWTALHSPEARVVRRAATSEMTEQAEETPYRDVLEACRNERCAVLVGEPGAGKTTTLLRRAHELAADGTGSAETPLPLFARLRSWDPIHDTLERFLSGQFAPLGDVWLDLLQRERAVLMLDGLNELPLNGRAERVREIADFLERSRAARFLLSSRRLEYEEYRLPFPRIQILPLKPSGVFDLTRAVLRFELEDNAKADADALQRRLFWEHLVGAAELEMFQGETSLSLDDFFRSDRVQDMEPPSGPRWRRFLERLPVIGWRFFEPLWDPWEWDRKKALWRVHNTERSLLRLASNPFWLTLMLSVFLEQGRLPEERIGLMQSFVRSRLVREKLGDAQSGEPDALGKALLAALADFAFTLQSRSGAEGARVGMARSEAVMLDDSTLKRALGCGLVVRGEESLSFVHQLFQEYFALEGLQRGYESRRFLAEALWSPDGWWQAGAWEETARFLAGRYADDPDAFQQYLGWLAPANPRLLADCAKQYGITPDASVCKLLVREWLPRMIDDAALPDPRARAAVGLALGSLGLATEALSTEAPCSGSERTTQLVALARSFPSSAWERPFWKLCFPY